ncbi:MAG: ABC-F family ATP-binding cassette domain-containing protein [Chloroflexi bacterium]|nr:ABC-F family ATP-binding cassette domain-containing protein [Chloroflexota bacterium]
MRELARLQGVQQRFGPQSVLSGVTFGIAAEQKLGLIGVNGSGKTSLLRLLAGEDAPTAGSIARVPGLRLGYVPQQVAYEADETVLDTVLAEHARLERSLREHEERLATASGDEVGEAVAAYDSARQAFEEAGGDRARPRAIGMLDSLGLAGRAGSLVRTLSGGEKNVLSLVRALLAEPELLLLDEPANHLDFEGIAWLEGFLRGFKGAILIVSHNRYLLDRVVGGILHLEGGKVRAYAGNYSTYRATVLREKLAQQADYVANQKRLAQLEALVKRFEEYARRTGDSAWGKRLRARRSQLAREQAQAVEKPQSEASSIRVRLATEASQADIALQLRGYRKAFGELRLFEGADLEIYCGERVALLGTNGSGKTTLLRDIIEHGAWDHPVIRIGPSLRVGYCAQEQEVLDDDRTVLQEILADGSLSRDQAYSVLARFLFYPDDFEKRVGDLSGGERNRLQLASVLTKNPNFLILDEPTNHFDIPAREAVEEVLADFKGTILLVSHDRYLLDKVADRIVEVRDRQLVSHQGNFSEFWSSRRSDQPRQRARVATRRRRREREPSQTETARPRERQREPSELDSLIEKAEEEKLALESGLADAFTHGDHREGARLSRQLDQHTARLEALYARWLREEGA